MLAACLFPILFPLSALPSPLGPAPALVKRDHSKVPGGFVALREGNYTLVTDQGIRQVRKQVGDFDMAWRGHVEVGVMSEVELRWSGEGSLRSFGPASIEWIGSPFTGKPLGLLDFTRIELEVRSGELGARLPGGVFLVAERSAFEMIRRPSGAYGIHHLGGKQARVILPAVGSPDARDLHPGSWLWIDPSDFIKESRFEMAFKEQHPEAGAVLIEEPSRFTQPGKPLGELIIQAPESKPIASITEALPKPKLLAMPPSTLIIAEEYTPPAPINVYPAPKPIDYATSPKAKGKVFVAPLSLAQPVKVEVDLSPKEVVVAPIANKPSGIKTAPRVPAAPLLPLTLPSQLGVYSAVPPLLLLQNELAPVLDLGSFKPLAKPAAPKRRPAAKAPVPRDPLPGKSSSTSPW